MSTEQRQMDLDGHALTVLIKRSAQRRRRLSLTLDINGNALLRVPLKTPNREIEAMLARHRDWLKDKTRQLAQYQQDHPPLGFVDGDELAFQGTALRLTIERAAGPVRFQRRGEQLLLRAPREDADAARSALRQWYREQAAILFPARLAYWSEQLDWVVQTPPLRLRQMRSRWGSCSSEGRICLNTELVRLAPVLLDYVIVHELCHLQEFNHSPRFYALMDAHFPDWQRCRQQLAATALRGV